MKMKFKLSPQAEKKLKDKIKEQAGAKVERLLFAIQDRFLAATPMNSGRTLASWQITRGEKSRYDAVHDFPELDFYEQDITDATNHLPIGSEPGRSFWIEWAKRNREILHIRKDPYHKFFVSNAASLGSMFKSDLNQGLGSRAFYLDVGAVPGYDVYSHPNGGFIFDPRGTGFYNITMTGFIRDMKAI